MPMKRNFKNEGVVQRCEDVLSGCIPTVQHYSDASVQGNSAVGRGSEALRMPSAPVAPTVRALNSTQGGSMSSRISATRLPRQTQVIVQYGNEPARVLLFPYPVEVDIRPAQKRAA
jgi:hypothetical protein